MPEKPGRPPTGNARDIQYRLRMTVDESAKLDYCCEVYGLTKAEVIRRGIDELYEKAQKEK